MPDDISLYRLESGLLELLDYLQERKASKEHPPSDEELAALEAELKAYVYERLPQKIDSVAAVLLWKERRVGNLREDLDRLKRAINAESADLERLKTYTADVLALLPEPKKGSRELIGATHTLSLRGNGGVQPMVVDDEAMVPDDYRDAVVTMPYDDWIKIEAFVPNAAKVTVTLNNARIREALEQECTYCLGKEDAWPTPCPSCGGSGHRGVPGCHLAPRGQSIQVK